MITDGIVNGSGSTGSDSDSATGLNGDVTNASIVTGTTIDITVAGNIAVAELFSRFIYHLQKGRMKPALFLS
jgi:hypothetical protein